jgi:hypothetical protein
MGARIRFERDAHERMRPGFVRRPQSFRIDIGHDKIGEFFSLRGDDLDAIKVVNVQPKDRHLLLVAKVDGEKSKFLCGHDERQWFVAAVPERISGVVNVRTAMEALKPAPVIERQTGKAFQGRRRRRNEAYVRQGEWFFVPVQIPEPKIILRNEPIRRGGGKPHVCEFLARQGGTQVYVGPGHANGILFEEFEKLNLPRHKRMGWQIMVRDAGVFVKGKITHPDHATVVLKAWHRVLANRESESIAMRHVAFLD